MSKLSAVSPLVTEVGKRPRWPGVILFSLWIATVVLLQSCGNKGDLYRESDAAAIKGLQEAADKLRNQPVEVAPEEIDGENTDAENVDGDGVDRQEDDETGKKPVKKIPGNAASGN